MFEVILDSKFDASLSYSEQQQQEVYWMLGPLTAFPCVFVPHT